MKTFNKWEAARLRAKLRGENPPEPDKNREFLFYYSVWTFIQYQKAITITESQAEAKLKQFPKMEVTYCYLIKSKPDIPKILKGRKIEKLELTGHDALSDLIFERTGVKVPEADLMVKQNMMAKDDRPLVEKIRSFNIRSEAQKRSDETKARILKCLQEADAKMRAKCLKDCKTK